MTQPEARIGKNRHARALEHGAVGLLLLALTVAGGGAYTTSQYREHLNVELAAQLDGEADAARIADLVRHGAKLNMRSARCRYTPLTIAALRGDESVLRELLERGAPADAPGYEGQSALMFAVITAQSDATIRDLMRALLASGADPNFRSPKGDSPLTLAAACNRLVAVRELLAHGATVDQRDGNGNTPLLAASGSGAVQCVELLLQHGAAASALNDSGDGGIDLAWSGLIGRLSKGPQGSRRTPWLIPKSLSADDARRLEDYHRTIRLFRRLGLRRHPRKAAPRGPDGSLLMRL